MYVHLNSDLPYDWLTNNANHMCTAHGSSTMLLLLLHMIPYMPEYTNISYVVFHVDLQRNRENKPNTSTSTLQARNCHKIKRWIEHG